MGFVNKPKQSKPKQHEDKAPSKKDMERAKQLYNLLATHRRIMHPPKLTNWAVWFMKIRDVFTSAEVDEVLGWYCKNIKEAHAPRVFSAESFYDKFPQIKDVADRDQPPKPPEYHGKITKEAKKLAALIAGWGWPKGSEAQLPVVVQVSLNNLQTFKDKMGAVKRRMAAAWEKIQDDSEDPNKPPANAGCKEARLARYCQMIDAYRLTHPPYFAERWFEDFYDRVKRWGNWDGVIPPIETDSKRFGEEMMDVGMEHCGDYRLWALLQGEL